MVFLPDGPTGSQPPFSESAKVRVVKKLMHGFSWTGDPVWLRSRQDSTASSLIRRVLQAGKESIRVALGREVKALASDVSLLFGGECHFSLLRLLPFVYPFSLRCNGYVAAEIYNGTHGVFPSRGTIISTT